MLYTKVSEKFLINPARFEPHSQIISNSKMAGYSLDDFDTYGGPLLMSDYYNDAPHAKQKLSTISDSSRLAKWKQVSLHDYRTYKQLLSSCTASYSLSLWLQQSPHYITQNTKTKPQRNDGWFKM